MNKLTPIAAALVLISGVANATTFSAPSASPNPATLSGGSAAVNYTIPLSHADGVPGSCGLQLDYGDGSAPEPFLAHATETSLQRSHVYTKAGTFNATLSPVSMPNPAGAMRPACSGSPVSALVTVNSEPQKTGNVSGSVVKPSTMLAAFEPATLTTLRPIKNGKGAAADEYIEDIPLSVEVGGNNANACGYRVTGENLVNHHTVQSKVFTSFGAHEVFTFKGHTKYRVSVAGEKSGDIPACKGQLSQDITVKNDRAWIKDVKVGGVLRYHYGEGDADVDFGVNALTIGDGKPCSYALKWKVGGDVQTIAMRYKGTPPKVDNPIDFSFGMNSLVDGVVAEVRSSDSGLRWGKTPQVANTATLTVMGIGDDACNGQVQKTITVPVDAYIPIWLGKPVYQ